MKEDLSKYGYGMSSHIEKISVEKILELIWLHRQLKVIIGQFNVNAMRKMLILIKQVLIVSYPHQARVFTMRIWKLLRPNEHNDWLNQRSDLFSSFIPLGDKDDKSNTKTVFAPFYSRGLATTRDAWCYNSSKRDLENNIKTIIDFYNEQKGLFKQKNQSCMSNSSCCHKHWWFNHTFII